MPNKKQPYTWGRVNPGDIISFRYKSKSGKSPKVQSVLVLNPRFPVTLKNGKRTRHLIGIKLEESNKIELRITNKQLKIWEQIGDFYKIDDVNNLFKLEIKKRFIINDAKGVKPKVYNLLSRGKDMVGQYRTYDYLKVKKSAVYLEPIRVFANED